MAFEILRDFTSPYGPDSPREIERKLNSMFRELYSSAGAAGLTKYSILKMTVSAADGYIDSPIILRQKLNEMLVELTTAGGVTGIPLPEIHYTPFAGGYWTGTNTLRQMNIMMSALYAAWNPGSGGGPVTPTPQPLKVLFIGSSTPDKYFTEFTGTPNAGVYKTTNGTTMTPVGTSGSGAILFGNALNDALNRDIQLFDFGVGGSTAVDWDGNANNCRTLATSAGLAAGGVDYVFLALGYNDAFRDLMSSSAEHLARMRSIVSKIRTELGQPNLKFLYSMAQSSYASGASDHHVQFNYLYAAEQTFLTDPNIFFGAHSWDLSQLADGIHLSQTATPVHAARMASNLLRIHQGLASNKGPVITSVEGITYTTTEITLLHDQGSDITPLTDIRGFVLQAGSTVLNVSAVVRSAANKVQFTHDSNGGTPVTVFYVRGASPIKTNPLRDNALVGGYGQPPFNRIPYGITAASAGTGGSTVTKVAKIAFTDTIGQSGSTMPAGWNGILGGRDVAGNTGGAPETYGRTVALKNPDNVALGWSLELTTGFIGSSTNSVTGNQIYPKKIAEDYWFVGDSTASPANARIPSATQTLKGLDPAKQYKIEIWGRREAATPRVTAYTIGGTTINQTSNGNNSTLATFTVSPDANGDIAYTIAAAGTGNYGYLNAVVVTEL